MSHKHHCGQAAPWPAFRNRHTGSPTLPAPSAFQKAECRPGMEFNVRHRTQGQGIRDTGYGTKGRTRPSTTVQGRYYHLRHCIFCGSSHVTYGCLLPFRPLSRIPSSSLFPSLAPFSLSYPCPLSLSFSRTPLVRTILCGPDRKTRGRFRAADLPWRRHSHFVPAILPWSWHSIEFRCPIHRFARRLPSTNRPNCAMVRKPPPLGPKRPKKQSTWGSLCELRRLRAAPG